MKIAKIIEKCLGRQYSDYAGCYGIILDEDHYGLTMLLLKDRTGKPMCHIVYRIHPEDTYLQKNSADMGFSDYPPSLYDGNIQNIVCDISQLMKDGRKHREIKKLYA